MADPFRICMVCTGNICRSPIAEVVLRRMAEDAGLGDAISVTSAGTGEWHVGEQADPRTLVALENAGYDGRTHRARQFDPSWFDDLDLVVALDRSHERILRSWARSDDDRSKIRLLLSFDPEARGSSDVADPYYGDAAMFDAVLAEIERADRALFHQIAPAMRATHHDERPTVSPS
ncbi:low molecular weight protein-tyrosine-phosphatase [Cnuibacter sp. UC19_7]|uniref:low molecular weight protein-tyrosine-phosphatase n=1 Tax=Cnuibacter sp. UC19_7 TaxID=3350166 RepID=UPI00366C1FBB